MSGTNAFIVVRAGHAQYKCVWVHYDGYPNGVGRKLINHYNNQERAELLVAGGSIEAIGDHIETSDGKDQTRYLIRDEGYTDPGWQCQIGKTPRAAMAKFPIDYVEYIYFWDGKMWRFGDLDGSYLADLKDALWVAGSEVLEKM